MGSSRVVSVARVTRGTVRCRLLWYAGTAIPDIARDDSAFRECHAATSVTDVRRESPPALLRSGNNSHVATDRVSSEGERGGAPNGCGALSDRRGDTGPVAEKARGAI